MVIFTYLALAALLMNSTLAAPWPASMKHANHQVRSLPNGIEVSTFSPPSRFDTFGTGIDLPLSRRAEPADIKDISAPFVSSRLGISEDEISFKKAFTCQTAKHAFLRQKIVFASAVANVALNSDDKVVTNFVKPESVSSTEPKISNDNSAVLTHVVQIESHHLLEALVDAESGGVVAVNDSTADSAFLSRICCFSRRMEHRIHWNCWEQCHFFQGFLDSITQESSSGLIFNYPADDTSAPTAGTNLDAARTNTFYVSNTIHDITYRYGFTESALNFQNDNFGNGGVGNDRVTISVQDSAGTNNADFTPQRDGALENDIVAHENTHGLSDRLTGGCTGRCLQTREAGGMGEGWSDAFEEWTEQTADIHDFTLGSYVTNDPAGICSVPYSTNKTVDPLIYSDLQTRTEVLDIGDVWATILHDTLAALVDAHGFSSEANTNPDGTENNILVLQPCDPTFLQARDAWIQADINRFTGVFWFAFAGRGLGVNAANHENDATIPSDC
ncbi:hypothetical protein ACEPAF_8037 [Sanghuangporus sanghuang]